MTTVEIYIGKNGDVIGKYAIEELIDAISDGRVLPTDEAWYRGMAGWRPVSEAVPPLLPLIYDQKPG